MHAASLRTCPGRRISLYIDSHLSRRTIETLSRPSRPHRRRSPTPIGSCRPRGFSAVQPLPLSLFLSLSPPLPPPPTVNFPKPSLKSARLSTPRSGEIFPIVTRSALPGAHSISSAQGRVQLHSKTQPGSLLEQATAGRWHPIAVADLRRHFRLMGSTAASGGI